MNKISTRMEMNPINRLCLLFRLLLKGLKALPLDLLFPSDAEALCQNRKEITG